jgi:hypothetical protein
MRNMAGDIKSLARGLSTTLTGTFSFLAHRLISSLALLSEVATMTMSAFFKSEARMALLVHLILRSFTRFFKRDVNAGDTTCSFAPEAKNESALRSATLPPPAISADFPSKFIAIG